MNTSLARWSLCCAVGAVLLAPYTGAVAQSPPATPARTIVGDLLMIDREFYIVRSDLGEIQIEATPQTKMAKGIRFGDRIKASVLANNKALTIERAGPDDVPGVVDYRAPHDSMPAVAPVAPAAAPAPGASGAADAGKAMAGAGGGKTALPAASSVPPKRPTGKTIVGDLLMIDREFYIVRSDLGEIQIEATPQTKMAKGIRFGDRIKASVLMNNKALTIERAGPDDVPGVVVHGASRTAPRAVPEAAGAMKAPEAADTPVAGASRDDVPAMPAASVAGHDDETKVVEGQVLMVDGDFYVIRGERGEIRVERTPDTRMTETFKFGDFIKATVTPTDRALVIERLR